MGKGSGYFRLKTQGRLFEKMLFGMRFSHLKMRVEGKKNKQCNGPKAGTSLVSYNGRKVNVSETE